MGRITTDGAISAPITAVGIAVGMADSMAAGDMENIAAESTYGGSL
jgi:hypothetical protein